MIRFKPARYMSNRHIQTIFPAIFSRPELSAVEEEIFELSDGDFVELLWYKKSNLQNDAPIMILFHGLAGSFESPYIKRAMLAFGEEGYTVVLMHFRGCGKQMNRLARSYHSGESGDAKELILALKRRYHDSDIYATGYSLGANMLLKLLGEWGAETPLKGVIAVSAPLDLIISVKRINQGFSRFYQKRMLDILKRDLNLKYRSHDLEKLTGFKQEDIKGIGTFWEFDDAYTAPVHGFRDARDYYEKCSAIGYLQDIKIPTLIINAKDDPFTGEDIIPNSKQLSCSICLEVTRYGGHVGFVAGSIYRPHYWLESRMLTFFATIRAT